MTTRRIAVLIPIINLVLFYGWILIYKEDEWLRTLGAAIFPVIGCTISFIWIIRAFYKSSSEKKNFWKLFSFGLLFYLSGSLFWLFSILIKGVGFNSTTPFLLWLLAYIFFLLALTHKTKTISAIVPNSPYIFNIFVFMTAAISISIYYLITPIWNLLDKSLLSTIISISYPITDLSILFLITYLFYISKYSKERKLVLLFVLAFILQIIADSAYIYLLSIDSYNSGTYIDLIWVASIMFIGFAGLYGQNTTIEFKWDYQSPLESHESFFPYGSAIILLFLVLHSYLGELNTLSIGLMLIFLMIIVRQLLIMKKNKSLMSEYRYLAYHDSLTGLNNRSSFNEDLQLCLKQANQNNYMIGLLIIDLDRFKLVNDTLGHFIGDQLLKSASDRLKQTIRENHRIYRLGGDEFVIILPRTTKKQCVFVAEKIIKHFSKSFLVSNHEITITTSIGISLYPNHGEDTEQLLKNADTAMYQAKGNGRNNYHFFNSDLNKVLVRKMKIEHYLRKAIVKKQLQLYYQPIVNLKTRKPIGMEALLRWEHPDLGTISPAEFIPIAEETGQIVSIGEWVLRMACKQNMVWQQEGFPHLCVSVNVSVRQFQDSNFINTVRNVLLETGLKSQYLELEITESIMQNVKESIKVLKELREIGVKTAIDDFGTGYSSLHILKELPIDTIKIDKLFIDDVSGSPTHSIVKSIIDIGLNLNLKVIAEGIEFESQLSTLQQYNCHFGQGYLFLKPVDAQQFENTLIAMDNDDKSKSNIL